MNKEIADKWCERLRSGKFKQGRGSLKRFGKNDGIITYCCLGVLADMAVEEGVIEEPNLKDNLYFYDNNVYAVLLPPVVQNWAGLKTCEGKISSLNTSVGASLAYFNDKGISFNDIAVLIEKNVDKL